MTTAKGRKRPMKAPFEKFEVRRGWFLWSRFIVEVTMQDFKTNDEGRDMQADNRRFIEEAIREKLEREAGTR